MTTRDHERYRDDAGAYLLGALTDLERQAFERHLAGCRDCRDELDRLRPAADALPYSVDQVAPPPGLKASLMEVVEAEAGVARPHRRPAWLRGLALGGLRPALVAGALALGLLAGFGLAQLTGGEGTRSVVATVDERMPGASARLQITGDGEDGAILRVQGMPPPGEERVYQAWLQRDGTMVPQPTFEVGEDGRGAVAVTDDLSDAEAVLVTREPRGGARAPSEQPILSVPL